MKRIIKYVPTIFIFLLLAIYFTLLIKNGNLQLLNPQGYIAQIQSQLLWGALLLGACIGIPLVGTIIFIAFKYKDGNIREKYTPEWTGGRILVFIWWIIPTIFVLTLSIIIWKTAHAVDPYKPLTSHLHPITIQVVALRWKWLFLYPKEDIATINFIEFPVNTPINFQLTADAPMNSFWIPSLGGQIYAMAGMVTQLHFIANKTGDFPGGGAEMSGEGFSGMQFTARSVSQATYNMWVQKVKKSNKTLNLPMYYSLAMPSSYNSPTFYRLVDKNLYKEIVMQFMAPTRKVPMQGM